MCDEQAAPGVSFTLHSAPTDDADEARHHDPNSPPGGSIPVLSHEAYPCVRWVGHVYGQNDQMRFSRVGQLYLAPRPVTRFALPDHLQTSG